MNKDSGNSGFTLVEVIISVAVLCIVCVVILRLFVTAGDLNDGNLIADRANVEAINRMEQLKLASDPKEVLFENETDSDGSLESREYYDKQWNPTKEGQESSFVIVSKAIPIGDEIYTNGRFGETDGNDGFISSLYVVTVSVMDNEGNLLTKLESKKYYQYEGGQDD